VSADHASPHRFFRAQELISSGVVEILNNKAKVTIRKSYGFRTDRVLELASITHLASSLSRNRPTISSDEPKSLVRGICGSFLGPEATAS
jgi:hypothetical protein